MDKLSIDPNIARDLCWDVFLSSSLDISKLVRFASDEFYRQSPDVLVRFTDKAFYCIEVWYRKTNSEDEIFVKRTNKPSWWNVIWERFSVRCQSHRGECFWLTQQQRRPVGLSMCHAVKKKINPSGILGKTNHEWSDISDRRIFSSQFFESMGRSEISSLLWRRRKGIQKRGFLVCLALTFVQANILRWCSAGENQRRCWRNWRMIHVSMFARTMEKTISFPHIFIAVTYRRSFNLLDAQRWDLADNPIIITEADHHISYICGEMIEVRDFLGSKTLGSSGLPAR